MRVCTDKEITTETCICSACGEAIGLNNFPELVLCRGYNLNHRKHAFHRKCMAEWVVQREPEEEELEVFEEADEAEGAEQSRKAKEVCPVCKDDGEIMYAKSRDEVLEEFILQSIKEEKGLSELRRRASRGILGESEQIDFEAADHFKMLEEVHNELLRIYVHAPRDFTSPEDSEIERIFEEIVEEMLGKMPMEEVAQALVNAPRFIYTYNVLDFIHDPMFYAQLNYRQVVDFLRHLFILAAGDRDFGSFYAHIVDSYTYHNLGTLDSSAAECLFDLAVSLDLEEIQYNFLLALIDNNIHLSLKCREKLAIPILRNQVPRCTEKLFLLQSIGYFTEFTDGMRQGAIDHWTQSRRGQKGDDKLFLDILSFRSSKIEAESRTEILEYLKEIADKQYVYNENEIEILELKCYRHIVRYFPNGSFPYKYYRSILGVRFGFLHSRIISFVPSTDFKMRRNLVLISEELKRDYYISPAIFVAMYLHPGITFEVALRSLFDCAVLTERREAYALQIIVYFKVFFRKDLQDGVNARLLFNKLRRNRLHVLMPLFREHFSKMPLYEECIASNMGEIIDAICHIDSSQSIRELLRALCDTNSYKINKALCSHFLGFLEVVLDRWNESPLSRTHLLGPIFANDAFAGHITVDLMKETVLILTAHYNTTDSFEKEVEALFLNTEARGRMLTAIEELALSFSGELNEDTKSKLTSLSAGLKALVPLSTAGTISSLDGAPPKKKN